MILKAVVERTMKVQEVILRAMAKRITWWQAAEILGISDRAEAARAQTLREVRLRRAVGNGVVTGVETKALTQLLSGGFSRQFDGPRSGCI